MGWGLTEGKLLEGELLKGKELLRKLKRVHGTVQVCTKKLYI
jgi:hypothetical protein